ncbi:MAG: hypothetical protein U9R60_12065 [Bacteroidota bacterium]|nr:hypothetical protein [Bacteroidota bacterium]
MDIMLKSEKEITGIRLDNVGEIEQDTVRKFFCGVIAQAAVVGPATVIVENGEGNTHILTIAREEG